MRRKFESSRPVRAQSGRSLRRMLSAGATAVAVVAGGSTVVAPSVAGAQTSTHAGDGIVITTEDGRESLCTMNSVTEQHGEFYGLTAGHCINPEELGSAPVEIATENGQLLADREDIDAGGVNRGGGANPFDPYAGLDDFGWFRLDDSVTPNTGEVSSAAQTGIPVLDDFLRGHGQPVAGHVPVTQNLVGTIVCKDGTMSGRTCGPVLAVNTETQEITALIPAIAGDSGSPLHIAGENGERLIVGTLSNGTPVLFNTFDGTREHLDAIWE